MKLQQDAQRPRSSCLAESSTRVQRPSTMNSRCCVHLRSPRPANNPAPAVSLLMTQLQLSSERSSEAALCILGDLDAGWLCRPLDTA